MSGWLIGVMLEIVGEPAPLRHYFAVGFADRAKAEWTALDAAAGFGFITTSPFEGQEPVEALSMISTAKMKRFGLAAGAVRVLGRVHPRKWFEYVIIDDPDRGPYQRELRPRGT